MHPLKFTNAPDVWGMSEAGKLSHMTRQKGLGNQYFAMKLYKKACVRYDTALECFTDKMIGLFFHIRSLFPPTLFLNLFCM